MSWFDGRLTVTCDNIMPLFQIPCDLAGYSGQHGIISSSVSYINNIGKLVLSSFDLLIIEKYYKNDLFIDLVPISSGSVFVLSGI